MTRSSWMIRGAVCGVTVLALASTGSALAADDKGARRAQVINHWTAERRAQAIPRDLVIDSRGLGYLRRADGSLVPHGHQISALQQPVPRAKPPGTGGGGGNSDTTPPVISDLDPAAGATRTGPPGQ